MAGKKSPAASWNFLRDNARLRSIILYKIEANNIKWVDLAKQIGTHDFLIKYYCEGRKPSLTNYNIIKLAQVLDIDVELSVNLKSPLTSLPSGTL